MNAEMRLNNVLTHLFSIMPMFLNEQQRRLLAGCVALGYGYGGVMAVHNASGAARTTVYAGISEITGKVEIPEGAQRRKGGGRKALREKYLGLDEALDKIILDSTYGDPERVLFWTTLSLEKIAKILFEDFGYKIGKDTVKAMLRTHGYSKQANRKMLQVGASHPNRDAQFRFINDKAKAFMREGFIVISVDTKKKENIGNFKNNGQEYRMVKDAREVFNHDFPLEELGKVAPYGVYVVNDNTGFVNLGISSDTSEFAVESIRRWWYTVGQHTFPGAKNIYITCDGGGSNSSRSRLWKRELACFAEETGLSVHVSHFPPGTSKWNKVEHRLFCYISKNWQGRPLTSIETVVNLIASTTTKNGLKVVCQVDESEYKCKIKVEDKEFEKIDLRPIGKFGEWNYCIKGFKKEASNV